MKPQIVIYLNDKMEVVPEDQATMVSVTDETGQVTWGRFDEAETRKSIDSITSEYRDALTGFATQSLRGRMTAIDFRRSVKALIRSTARRAYVEGMEEGGIEGADNELESDDLDTIESWMDDQVTFVDAFAQWMVGLGFTADTSAQADQRVEFWVNSLRTLANLGRAAALNNPVCIWEMDEAIEAHCETCRKLDGTSHRLDWYKNKNYLPQQPGASMKCGGYHCGCTLKVKKTGVQLFP